MDRISPNFIYAFILTRSTLGLLHIFFSHNCNRVMTLDFRQNFISAQYLDVQCSPFWVKKIKHCHNMANVFTKEFCKGMIGILQRNDK